MKRTMRETTRVDKVEVIMKTTVGTLREGHHQGLKTPGDT